MWTELWFAQNVAESEQNLLDVARHADVYTALITMPIEGDSATKFALWVDFCFAPLAEEIEKAVQIFPPDTLDAEIVNHEGELDRPRLVREQAGRVLDFGESTWLEALLQQFVS